MIWIYGTPKKKLNSYFLTLLLYGLNLEAGFSGVSNGAYLPNGQFVRIETSWSSSVRGFDTKEKGDINALIYVLKKAYDSDQLSEEQLNHNHLTFYQIVRNEIQDYIDLRQIQEMMAYKSDAKWRRFRLHINRTVNDLKNILRKLRQIDSSNFDNLLYNVSYIPLNCDCENPFQGEFEKLEDFLVTPLNQSIESPDLLIDLQKLFIATHKDCTTQTFLKDDSNSTCTDPYIDIILTHWKTPTKSELNPPQGRRKAHQNIE